LGQRYPDFIKLRFPKRLDQVTITWYHNVQLRSQKKKRIVFVLEDLLPNNIGTQLSLSFHLLVKTIKKRKEKLRRNKSRLGVLDRFNPVLKYWSKMKILSLITNNYKLEQFKLSIANWKNLPKDIGAHIES